jgi:hypothetical protein
MDEAHHQAFFLVIDHRIVGCSRNARPQSDKRASIASTPGIIHAVGIIGLLRITLHLSNRP